MTKKEYMELSTAKRCYGHFKAPLNCGRTRTLVWPLASEQEKNLKPKSEKVSAAMTHICTTISTRKKRNTSKAVYAEYNTPILNLED